MSPSRGNGTEGITGPNARPRVISEMPDVINPNGILDVGNLIASGVWLSMMVCVQRSIELET